jgi:PRTRC genetic system protein C
LLNGTEIPLSVQHRYGPPINRPVSGLTTITTAAERTQTKKKRGTRDMALTVTKMTRVFQFNGIRLPDPNPEMSVDNVKALYSAEYPELTTAVVNGPEAVGDKMRYTFDRAIGSKG